MVLDISGNMHVYTLCPTNLQRLVKICAADYKKTKENGRVKSLYLLELVAWGKIKASIENCGFKIYFLL